MILVDVSEEGWKTLAALAHADEFVACEETGEMWAIIGDYKVPVGDELDELLARGYVEERDGDRLVLTESGLYQAAKWLRKHDANPRNIRWRLKWPR
jgi:hypothetical protein